MQELYQRIKPGSSGNNNVLIEMVRRVENYREAIQFLQTLESIDRYGRKFVVLDCSAALASEIIIQHVKDVHLGRRNYHYLLSGLVSLILSSFFSTHNNITYKREILPPTGEKREKCGIVFFDTRDGWQVVKQTRRAVV